MHRRNIHIRRTLRLCWKSVCVSPARKVTHSMWHHLQPLYYENHGTFTSFLCHKLSVLPILVSFSSFQVVPLYVMEFSLGFHTEFSRRIFMAYGVSLWQTLWKYLGLSFKFMWLHFTFSLVFHTSWSFKG